MRPLDPVTGKISEMARAPGYNVWLPLPRGTVRDFMQRPLEFLLHAREQFGDVVRFQVGPYVTHLVFHPDQVTHILRDQQKNYLRDWQYNFLRRLFGENLVVSEGNFWRRQRRLAQPAFHHQRLPAYASVMIDATGKLMQQWEQAADGEGVVEVAPAMSRLALEIAGRTLFGQDLSREADAVGNAFGEVRKYLDYRFNHRFTSLPVSWPTARNRQFKRGMKELTDIVLLLIRMHRQGAIDRDDLLSMLMQARDEETGEQMTEQQMCIEALTFLIAGHETTAKGLAWTLYLLASNPEVRTRLHREIETELAAERPTIEQLPRLASTRMAIEEALRLYPPVWVVTRQAMADDEFNGFHIPAKSSVVLSPYVTHRHPQFWQQPDLFDIERFAPERADSRPKGAFFPFIYGPHQCIGMEFAMLEMCLVITMVVQRFDFNLVPEQNIRPTAALTLNPSGPVKIVVRRWR
jgi:cytochrome P450